MAEVREYTVDLNGIKTTMQLTEEHAEQLGATPVDDDGDDDDAAPPRKSRVPANKSRATETK